MFENILVPLDGSNLAETALPPAASLAATLGASVLLLHVIEKNAPQEVHHDRHLKEPVEATAYLDSVAQRAFAPGLKVSTHVHSAEVQDVTASLTEHTGEYQTDLVVMCAHGKSGFRDMIFGGIAQQVLAMAKVPMLLLQPKTVKKPQPFELRRILVPLDNESIHDNTLPYARRLAKAYGAELYLLSVVPTLNELTGQKGAASALLPATTTVFLDMKEQAAKDHLGAHLAELLDAGYKARAEVNRGDPASIIADVAEKIKADLVLLGTHSRAGLQAVRARSVAPNVMKKTKIPLLLIPMQ
jgi:nucleotide-binding universal stress UspA family protein